MREDEDDDDEDDDDEDAARDSLWRDPNPSTITKDVEGPHLGWRAQEDVAPRGAVLRRVTTTIPAEVPKMMSCGQEACDRTAYTLQLAAIASHWTRRRAADFDCCEEDGSEDEDGDEDGDEGPPVVEEAQL